MFLIYFIDLFVLDWGQIFGFLVGFIGIVFSGYSVLLYKKIVPKYYIKNNKIISGVKDSGKIEIRYLGNVVPNISSCDILFCNKGNKTLNKTDVATIDPFVISVKNEYKVLEAKLMMVSNYSNNVSCTSDTNKVSIDFDYFDKNEGFVIQIIHTGLNSSDIEIEGTIKGVGKIESVKPQKYVSLKYNMLSRIYDLIGFFLFFLISIYNLFLYKTSESSVQIISTLIISLLISLWFLISYILKKRKDFPKKFVKYFNSSKNN